MAAENQPFEMDEQLNDVPPDPLTEDGVDSDVDGEGFDMAAFDQDMPGGDMPGADDDGAMAIDGPAFDAPSFEDDGPEETDFADPDEQDDFGDALLAHEDEDDADGHDADEFSGMEDDGEDEIDESPEEDDVDVDVDPVVAAKKGSLVGKLAFPAAVAAFVAVGGYGGYTFLSPIMGWNVAAQAPVSTDGPFVPSTDEPAVAETSAPALPFDVAGGPTAPAALPPLGAPSGGSMAIPAPASAGPEALPPLPAPDMGVPAPSEVSTMATDVPSGETAAAALTPSPSISDLGPIGGRPPTPDDTVAGIPDPSFPGPSPEIGRDAERDAMMAQIAELQAQITELSRARDDDRAMTLLPVEPPLKPRVVDGYSVKGVHGSVAWVQTPDGLREVREGSELGREAGTVRSVSLYGDEWVVMTSVGVIVGE